MKIFKFQLSKFTIIYFLLSYLILVVLLWLVYTVYDSVKPGLDVEERGSTGDYISGIFNPFIAILNVFAFLVLTYTLKQNEVNDNGKKERLEKTKFKLSLQKEFFFDFHRDGSDFLAQAYKGSQIIRTTDVDHYPVIQELALSKFFLSLRNNREILPSIFPILNTAEGREKFDQLSKYIGQMLLSDTNKTYTINTSTGKKAYLASYLLMSDMYYSILDDLRKDLVGNFNVE